MNVDQLSQDIIWALNQTNFKWGVGLNESVLSRVIVGPVPDGFFQHDFVTPCAVLHVEQGKDTDEHPADVIAEQRWTLYLFASNASEQSGSAAVVGGNRPALGTSLGRGILEIEPLVKAQLFNQVGLTARPRTTGGQPTATGGRMAGVVAERALEIVATNLPSFPSYAPVRQLKGSGAGGVVSLTFAAAPARYDLIGFVWARGTSGGAYPTDPTLGTFVANPAATSLSDSPGAGTWPYSLFWAYDVTKDPYTGNGVTPAAPNAYSSFQTAQGGLVYVPAQVTVSA